MDSVKATLQDSMDACPHEAGKGQTSSGDTFPSL